MYLALDFGTTAFKAAVFDTQGRRLCFARIPYQHRHPGRNQVECSPRVYLRALARAIETCRGLNIRAIGLSSQANTLLPVDQRNRPMRDAIVWTDQRAKDEAASLRKRVGLRRFCTATGAPDLSPALFPCKTLWVLHNEPAVYGKAARWLDLKQWLMSALCGEAVADPSLRAIEGLGRISDGHLWTPMLKASGLAAQQLAPLAATQNAVGTLSARWQKRIGLASLPLIVNGCLDQVAAGLGAGCLRPGTAALNFGGVLAFFAVVSPGSVRPGERHLTGPHLVDGTWYVLPYLPAAGLAIGWLARMTGRSVAQLADVAARLAPGCDGLVALPHIGGLPYRGKESIRAGFAGLASHHSPAHLYRALLESMAFAVRDWVSELGMLGLQAGALRAIGGGAQASLWLRVLADATGLPVEVPVEPEASCLGAAMLAARADGRFPTLAQAAECWVRIARKVEPVPSHEPLYTETYERYRTFARFAERTAR